MNLVTQFWARRRANVQNNSHAYISERLIAVEKLLVEVRDWGVDVSASGYSRDLTERIKKAVPYNQFPEGDDT